MSATYWNGRTPPNGAARTDDERFLDALPQHHEYGKEEEDVARLLENGRADGYRQRDGDSTARPTSKIKCLDGLRGVACFLVFNYHFLWPWTPLIMLGYGARPPKSPEPFDDWAQLPIICLLHRGRPMVAIFFAISGYVLCRHVQTAIHQRRLDEAYKKLSSAVFRRIFRLYIPCTISMFAVALLAQMGAFRTEKSIYKGPDSAWINGTVTRGFFHNTTCPNGTVTVEGRAGVAAALHLQTPLFLNETIQDDDQLCLNITSRLHMPAVLYSDIDKPKVKKNATAGRNKTTTATSMATFRDFAEYHHDDPHNPASKSGKAAADLPVLDLSSAGANATNGTRRNFTWIQLGGSWEEHPLVHPHLPYAMVNFTLVYAEWANPFNFGHMHPRYDPHTWTIPKELRGSMVLYTFLLGTAALRARWRLAAGVALAAYSLTLGHWDMGVFVGGMLLSEVDLLRTGGSELSALLSPDDRALAAWMRERGGAGAGVSTRKARLLRWLLIVAALYLLSYPDAGAEFTPGFRTLSALAPRYYPAISRWMFWQAVGALLLVPCVLRSPTLRSLLEGPTAQYLGRVSFSFYLVHGPVLHSLGFWIMPRLFERLGRVPGYVVGWFLLLGVALYGAGWFHRKVDVWSVSVGRRLERALGNP